MKKKTTKAAKPAEQMAPSWVKCKHCGGPVPLKDFRQGFNHCSEECFLADPHEDGGRGR